MERSGVGIVSQLGVETTPGTAVAANKILPDIDFNLSPKYVNDTHRAQGSRVPTAFARNKMWAAGDFGGKLDYNTINYVLDGLFPAAAPSQIGSIQAYTRNYTPGVFSADSTRKTFTVQKGDATAADQFPFVQLQSFSLEASQDSFDIKGNAVAQYPTLNGSLTSSPTTVAQRPVQRGDINLYMDTSFAGIGGTQLTKAMREMFDLGEKFVEAWFHNRSAGSFTDVVEKAYEAKFEFTIAHDSTSRTLLAAMASNPVKYMRWEAQGALLGTVTATNYYELIQFDMALVFDSVEELKNSDGEPYAYKYSCKTINDSTLGGHMKVKTICGLAAI